MSTTNNRLREYFEGRGGSPYLHREAPANGGTTTVPDRVRTHVVTADGTNTVDLGVAAREGHEVTIVHDGGSNTPAIAFDDADFVGTGPSNLTSQGATATVRNIDGTTNGWVVVSTGSA